MIKSKETTTSRLTQAGKGVARPSISRLNKVSSPRLLNSSYSPVAKPIKISADNAYRQQASKAALSGAVTQLAAGLAACDEPINEQEMVAFPKVFADYVSEQWDVVEMLKGAVVSGGFSDQVIQRIVLHMGEDLKAYRKLMNHLFEFALADGTLQAKEIVLLHIVFSKLPIKSESFDAYLRYYIIPDISTDLSALGLPKRIKDRAVIKSAYYRELRKYHPDHFNQSDCTELYMHVLNERASFLHEAYKRLAEAKG